MTENRPKTGPARTQFKPGNNANPKGRPKLPPELKVKARESPLITRLEIKNIIDKYMAMSPAEIQEAVRNPKIRIIELTIAKIASEAVRTGDTSKLNFLLDRHVGKVKDEIEQSITVKSMHEMIVDECEKLENANSKGGSHGEENES